MKKHLLLLALSMMSFGVVRAQDGAKIEAEDAAYENCELVEGTQYSGGKALAMKRAMARSPSNTMHQRVVNLRSMSAMTVSGATRSLTSLSMAIQPHSKQLRKESMKQKSAPLS